MRLAFDSQDKIKRFCFMLVFLVVLIFQNNFQIVQALSMEKYQSGIVIEELRLKVPSDFKEVWLNSEKKIWEPWLFSKDGFLGRQIFWDKEKEEALILVNWKNKKLWKSIPIKEVNEIQEKFEENVKSSLKLSENPFKLIYEGELENQG